MVIVSPRKRYKDDAGFDGYSSAEFEIDKSDGNASNLRRHEGAKYV